MLTSNPEPSRSRFISAVVELVRSWWRGDRVRASPREGRLLRIAPGSLIRVGSTLATVCRRCVGQTAKGPYVLYCCEGDTGPCQLWVTPLASTYRPRVRWVEFGRENVLTEDEVEVFPRSEEDLDLKEK